MTYKALIKELSLHRDDMTSQIQIRIHETIKDRWKIFCEENDLDTSELFRNWLVAYMQKHNAIKIIKKQSGIRYDNIEDMPLDIDTESVIKL